MIEFPATPLLRCPIYTTWCFKIVINSITRGLSLSLTYKTLRVCGRSRNHKSNNNLKVQITVLARKKKLLSVVTL